MVSVQFGADGLVQLDFRRPPSGFQDVPDDFGHAMELVRPRDEIKHREILEKLRPMVLRHAADDADDQLWLAGLDFLHESDLADGLAFSLVADGACVEDDQVGVLFGIR